MSKQPIKENEFSPAPGGTSGAINYQTPYGTHASPEVSQNSNQFANSNQNKAVNQMGNTAKETHDTGSMVNNLDAIYTKKDTPTPDEVVTGIKHELHNMIKKDKRKAKEIVLTNLKKDPHFYGKLKMLNIDDKSMVDNMTENTTPVSKPTDPQQNNPIKCTTCGKTINFDKGEVFKNGPSYVCKLHSKNNMSESKQHPNDRAATTKVQPNIEETKKIFTELAQAKDKKYVVNSGIVDVMKQMWEQKRQRNSWRHGKTS